MIRRAARYFLLEGAVAAALWLGWSAIAPAPLLAQEAGTKPYDLLPFELGRQLPGDPPGRPPGTGFHVGEDFILPRFDLTERYNTNIYATHTSALGDFVTAINPTIDAYSGWSEHALNLHAMADKGLYAAHKSENYLDYQFQADGRFDVRENAKLTAQIFANQGHFDRGSPEDANGLTPTIYHTKSLDLDYFQGINRLNAELGFHAQQYRYDIVPATVGIIDTTFEDRDQYVSSLRFGYDIVPDEYTVFVRERYTVTDYLFPTPLGKNLDSTTTETVIGTEAKLKRLLIGEVFVGYLHQKYDTADFASFKGPAFGAKLSWAPTLLTVVRVTADRTIEDTDFNGASGFFQTAAAVAVDHELRRTVMLHGGFFVADQSYRGIARQDRIYQASIGMRYALNRFVYIGPAVSFTKRESNLPLANFEQMLGALRITAEL